MTTLRATVRSVLGAAFVAVLAAGCGGYAGDHPPVGGPGDFATPSQSAAIPQDPEAQPSTGASQAPPQTSTAGTPSSKPSAGSTKGSTGQACTLVGKLSTVSFTASDKIRRYVTSFRVTLTQGTLSRTAWTPADPTHPHGMPLVRGVFIANGQFTFVIGGVNQTNTALPGAWKGDKKARLLIEALGDDGRTLYQQSKLFSFKQSYPNGKACDKTPALSYSTELTAKDQFSALPKG